MLAPGALHLRDPEVVRRPTIRLSPALTGPAQVSVEDVRALQSDYVSLNFRKQYAAMLCILILGEWGILGVQLSGIFGEGAWLEDDNGIRDTINYHMLTIAQSCLILIQVICLTKWYQMRLRNASLFDRLWCGSTLWESGHRNAWIFEATVLLLHEPPFVVKLWHHAYKLQGLALLRVYLFFNLFRGRSYCVTIGGRLVCTIARISNNKVFQLRYWMYRRPHYFILTCTLGGWFLLTLAMYMGEEGLIDFDEAMWLTFITMTTVGYGDFSPKTRMGRLVAVIAALHGLLSSALLINIVSNWFSLTDPQRKAADFISEAKVVTGIESAAAGIVTGALRLAGCQRLGKPTRKALSNMKHQCFKFRRLRRNFERYQLSVHNPNESFDVNTRLNQILRAIQDLEVNHAMSSPWESSPLGRPLGHPPTSAAPAATAGPFGLESDSGAMMETMSVGGHTSRTAGGVSGVMGAAVSIPATTTSMLPRLGALRKRESRNAMHTLLKEMSARSDERFDAVVSRLDAISAQQGELAVRLAALESRGGGAA